MNVEDVAGVRSRWRSLGQQAIRTTLLTRTFVLLAVPTIQANNQGQKIKSKSRAASNIITGTFYVQL